MADDSGSAPPVVIRPLDEQLYTIEDEGLVFMKAQTGIEDPNELKKHILAVQAEAYAVSSLSRSRRARLTGF